MVMVFSFFYLLLLYNINFILYLFICCLCSGVVFIRQLVAFIFTLVSWFEMFHVELSLLLTSLLRCVICITYSVLFHFCQGQTCGFVSLFAGLVFILFLCSRCLYLFGVHKISNYMVSSSGYEM